MTKKTENKEENKHNENLEKIKLSLDNIENKKSKFLFCVPDSENPIASIYEIYFHAFVVKKMGYNVKILVEKGDYEIPKWVEKELTEHEHIPMSDPKLTVGPEDIMIIPEVFSNVMEQTKELPCLRIGLLQSVDYMMNSLIPGTDWSTFNVRDILTTSPSLVEWVDVFMGLNKFNIKKYDIGIPDYFEKSKLPQKPIISVIGRNPNEISKIVKLFYSKYPQYSWVTFDPMLTKSKPPQPMRRKDFAKRLQNNFAAVWVDRIASFGTFAIECMKSGTIPICLKPDIIPEYIIERDKDGNSTKIKDNCGVWTNNYYDIPVLIADVLVKFLDDGISPEVYKSMEEIASKHSQKNSEKQLTKIYEEYIEQRKKLFESAIEQDNNKNIKK